MIDQLLARLSKEGSFAEIFRIIRKLISALHTIDQDSEFWLAY